MPHLVRQSRRELSDRCQAIGLPDAVDGLLQVAIGSFQLCGFLFQLPSLPSFTIRQKPRRDTD
jgi:hypothetical protein